MSVICDERPGQYKDREPNPTDFVPDAGHAPTDAPYHNPGTTSAQVSGHWKNGHTHTHTQTHTHPHTHTQMTKTLLVFTSQRSVVFNFFMHNY